MSVNSGRNSILAVPFPGVKMGFQALETSISGRLILLILMDSLARPRLLVPFYNQKKGRFAVSLRVMVAVTVIGKLRHLSDEQVVSQVKENPYIQYFCNVPDEGLHTFVDQSTLTIFRERLGAKGAAIIEEGVFGALRRAGGIKNDAQLTDSTVMEDNIVYPTDVLLYSVPISPRAEARMYRKKSKTTAEGHVPQRKASLLWPSTGEASVAASTVDSREIGSGPVCVRLPTI